MRYYTAAALGRVLGLGEDQIRALTRQGVIREGRKENGLYDIEDAAREIIAAMRKDGKVEESADYLTERARLMRVKRRNAEYELGLKEKELHTTEDIELVISRILMNFRSKIRAIPARLAPQCAKLESREEVHGILKKATDEALEELADLDALFSEQEEEEHGAEAAGD